MNPRPFRWACGGPGPFRPPERGGAEGALLPGGAGAFESGSRSPGCGSWTGRAGTVLGAGACDRGGNPSAAQALRESRSRRVRGRRPVERPARAPWPFFAARSGRPLRLRGATGSRTPDRSRAGWSDEEARKRDRGLRLRGAMYWQARDRGGRSPRGSTGSSVPARGSCTGSCSLEAGARDGEAFRPPPPHRFPGDGERSARYVELGGDLELLLPAGRLPPRGAGPARPRSSAWRGSASRTTTRSRGRCGSTRPRERWGFGRFVGARLDLADAPSGARLSARSGRVRAALPAPDQRARRGARRGQGGGNGSRNRFAGRGPGSEPGSAEAEARAKA